MASEDPAGTGLAPWTYLAAVLESDLTTHAKCVAVVLFSHMSLRGESVFPEIATIAREASLSVRPVRDAMRGQGRRAFAAWELRAPTRRKWSARKYRLRVPAFEFDLPSDRSEVHGVHPSEVHDVHLSRRTTQRMNNYAPNPFPEDFSGKGDGLGEWFEQLWVRYPNQAGKARAYKTLARLNPSPDQRAKILAGLERWRRYADLKAAPLLSSWLRLERWREALSKRLPWVCETCGGQAVTGDGRSYWCDAHNPDRRAP